VYEDLAARAGLALSPADCWLLLRLHEHAPTSATTLADRLQLPASVLDPHLQRLTERGDLAAADGRLELTDGGRAAAERLVESRTEQLASLLGDVPADERAELMDTLHQLAASLLAGPAGRTLLAAA
jgi:DNA-binding MarR family transcriptional regulator